MSSQSVEISAEANFIQGFVSNGGTKRRERYDGLDSVSGRLTAQRARTRPVVRPGIKENQYSVFLVKKQDNESGRVSFWRHLFIGGRGCGFLRDDGEQGQEIAR